MAGKGGTFWSDKLADAKESYSLSSHVTFAPLKETEHRKVIADYEPLKLSSFRVCCACEGTILRDPVLLIEQCIITVIFLMCALPVYIYFKDDLASSRKGAMDVNDWLAKQEPKMRAFAVIMTGLAAFLLSFYTSISVSRWWTIRTGGVGGIKAATMDLEMFVSQFCTKETQVLQAIRRYSRASLVLVFLWRGGKSKRAWKDELLSRQLLEPDEIENLLERVDSPAFHETIWAWQAGIVTMLYSEGRVKSEQLMSLLLERCSEGRTAVQLIHTHLAVRIPMQYVHLLGLLVKMHNFVMAAIMGILFGAALRSMEYVVCLQLFGRTLILPFLFNAILLINAELSDPFGGTESDFPCTAYEMALEKDGKGIVDAAANLPQWLRGRSQPPPGMVNGQWA